MKFKTFPNCSFLRSQHWNSSVVLKKYTLYHLYIFPTSSTRRHFGEKNPELGKIFFLPLLAWHLPNSKFRLPWSLLPKKIELVKEDRTNQWMTMKKPFTILAFCRKSSFIRWWYLCCLSWFMKLGRKMKTMMIKSAGNICLVLNILMWSAKYVQLRSINQ